MHTTKEILDAQVQLCKWLKEYDCNNEVKVGCWNHEVQVYRGIKALADAAGEEIYLASRGPGPFPWEFSFEYEGVRFYQIAVDRHHPDKPADTDTMATAIKEVKSFERDHS